MSSTASWRQMLLRGNILRALLLLMLLASCSHHPAAASAVPVRDPEGSRRMSEQSASLITAGKNEQALAAAAKAIELDAANTTAWSNKSAALSALRRYEDALQAAEQAREFLDQPVKTYSTGMYARLAFSIAIQVDPEILIVDETLAVGDARFVAKCMRRINDMRDQGATILFVSHDVASVRTLCDRAIWLNKGHMVEQGDVFPITGRYMAFLFKDEQTTEDALRDEITAQRETTSSDSRAIPIQEKTSVVNVAEENTATTAVSTVTTSEEKLDSRPVIHWGSHKGIILSASVRDKHGIRKDVHLWDNEIEIAIDVCIPSNISRDYLSVAFSIKDLKGTDLVVSSTYDFEKKRLPEAENFSVAFRLRNSLVTGKYLLVAAVEDRQNLVIHYYEYFEGAHYFSSLSNERIFGLFQPKIEQTILVN